MKKKYFSRKEEYKFNLESNKEAKKVFKSHMEKDLTDKIILRKSSLNQINGNFLRSDLFEKERPYFDKRDREERNLYSSLSYSFE